MLKKIRLSFAIVFLILTSLLFLDFTGTVHIWFGWMAKLQFVPAVLALNLVVCILLVLLTLLLGRVYCSVICPLGLLQDVVARMGRWKKKLPYTYSPPKSWLRMGVLTLFLVALILGVGAVASLLEPYGAFGRIAHNLFLPVWQWGNNVLATFAKRAESYAFYPTEVWLKSIPTLLVAITTLIVVSVLAWKNGRTYCNTICPVGTFLGFISPFSLFKIGIDTKKCIRCGICARKCKAACIDDKAHKIDYSRCIACMNCIDHCSSRAIGFQSSFPKKSEAAPSEKPDSGRKGFLAVSMLLAASALKAQVIPKATDIKPDGGLADVLDKQSPERQTTIVPAGASSLRKMKQHCTACQLCVTTCPNSVLRPSHSLERFMQPYISYERGYCRPECVKCSEVCPSGAIKKITKEEKSSIKIGCAVWVRARCIPLVDGQTCNNCAHHCPVKAITMVPSIPGDEKSLQIPAINEELCIGCGACEHLCPSRPLSAIYVEGAHEHRFI